MMKRVSRKYSTSYLVISVVIALSCVFLLSHLILPHKEAAAEPPPVSAGHSTLLLGQLPPKGTKQPAIMITGVLGFVGFHLAKALSAERVIGIDAVTATEDARMKYERLDLLHAHDRLTVIEGNACNASLWVDLLDRFEVKQILHLSTADRCSCPAITEALLQLPKDRRPVLIHPSPSACDGVVAVQVTLPAAYGAWQWPYRPSNLTVPALNTNISPDAVHIDEVVCGLVQLLGHSHASVQASYLPSSEHAGACALRHINSTSVIHTNNADRRKDVVQWRTGYESSRIPCECPCASSPSSCFASAWKTAMQNSLRLTKGCKIVLYTVLIGQVKEIHPVSADWMDPVHCNIAFVSESSPLMHSQHLQQASRWTFVSVADLAGGFQDSRKASRLPKLAPDAFFAESVDHALYIDSKLEINISPVDVLKLFNEGNAAHQQTVMMLVSHSTTRDLSHDAALVLANHRSNITHYPMLLRRQVAVYEECGYCYANTFDGAFILHELRSEAGRQLRCAWYREFLFWSDRDQISGNFIIAQQVNRTMQQQGKQVAGKCSRGREHLPIAMDSGQGMTYMLRMLPKSYYWRGSDILAKWERLD